MKFPPPLRFFVPALLLFLGLIAAWLDYELDLANDLERNFNDITTQAEVTGSRLATLARQNLAAGEMDELRQNLSAWNDEPWLKVAAVVDAQGTVLASSSSEWEGLKASDTPAAAAWKRIRPSKVPLVEAETSNRGEVIVLSAFPIKTDASAEKWLLVVYDRADSVAAAREDAFRQMTWSASVIAFFCLCLWATLHFGIGARLEYLARSVREFGEGRAIGIPTLSGDDEVHELSCAFAEMAQRLVDRECERRKLEREVVDSAEHERRRIGHELHDGIGQQLTAVLMAINGLHDDLAAHALPCAEKTLQVSRTLRETIAEVRGLSHGLAPVPLWERGLQHALQALADSTTHNSGVRCIFECPDQVPTTTEAMAGNLYRIAQEAVTNALRHAAPKEIRIGLECRDGFIVMEIDDDGPGLPETLPDGGGIGFRVMRHRTDMMGGRMEHGAPPAGGARIAVHIPANL